MAHQILGESTKQGSPSSACRPVFSICLLPFHIEVPRTVTLCVSLGPQQPCSPFPTPTLFFTLFLERREPGKESRPAMTERRGNSGTPVWLSVISTSVWHPVRYATKVHTTMSCPVLVYHQAQPTAHRALCAPTTASWILGPTPLWVARLSPCSRRCSIS